MDSPETKEVLTIEELLRLLPFKDSRTTGMLEKVLYDFSDSGKEARKEAVTALCKIGGEEAFQVLMRKMQFIDSYLRLTDYYDRGEKEFIVVALGSLAHPSAENFLRETFGEGFPFDTYGTGIDGKDKSLALAAAESLKKKGVYFNRVIMTSGNGPSRYGYRSEDNLRKGIGWVGTLKNIGEVPLFEIRVATTFFDKGQPFPCSQNFESLIPGEEVGFDLKYQPENWVEEGSLKGDYLRIEYSPRRKEQS